MERATFTRDDLEQLEKRGIAESEAVRQIELLRNPPGPLRLERACTVGDGIQTVSEGHQQTLLASAREAAASGRIQAFVPASGAASRMFQELIACREAGGEIPPAWLNSEAAAGRRDALAAQRFLDHLARFPFHDELVAAVERDGCPLAVLLERGPLRPILDALLDPPGLDYTHRPKGLLPFHRTRDGVRTAFAEHLAEAARLMRDGQGRCRLHFTVSAEHRVDFERALASVQAEDGEAGAQFEVGFSEQRPSSDTLALAAEGRPFRAKNGRLLFRPGGHGALIENLGGVGGDLAFIKNIDNVAHSDWKEPTWLWTRVLIGRLAEIEREVFARLDRLSPTDVRSVSEAIGLCTSEFFAHPPAGLGTRELAAWASDRLSRPIRVCGVVPNTGEPGGGPFWVRDRSGVSSIQIVEGAQVDPESPQQQELYRRSTHFNPAFLAVALRRRDGTPHDLSRFIDPSAVILAHKTSDGRPLLALERPGLWNGAMAHWNTVLVEVPLTVFNPVKSVIDLLRPEHQPRVAHR